MISGDTIVAVSSAAGAAARMIVRASGSDALQLAKQISPGASLKPGAAERVRLHFAGASVPAWLYSFGSPHSYTGENLVEFHVPGNSLLARMLLDALTASGARPADAGEFTARAYFNGRMDLSRAEGVAAVIAASNDAELEAARQLAAGALAARVEPVVDKLAELLGLVELGIDFSEEDVSFVSPAEVERQTGDVESSLAHLLLQSARLEPLSHEPTFVLVGRPNAGKSTLLNALAGMERAVVSPLAGTTRDVLRAEVVTPRGMVHLADAAGLNDAADPDQTEPQGEIARAMRRRAQAALAEADFVISVREATDTRPLLTASRVAHLQVATKIDLAGGNSIAAAQGVLPVSAITGAGLERLLSTMANLAFGRESGATLALNARHLQAIEAARQPLARARHAAPMGSELVAMELREAINMLGAIIGRVSPDDLLGRIFSRFCIGK